ncbi:MAG: hypothetical protein IJ209_06210 [Bacteroidaceae bacterium]|nr:hypothetical protein [Bacteroidaceae bacterium]
MEKIVIINESTFAQWTKSVERLHRAEENPAICTAWRKGAYRESDLLGILQQNYVPAARHIH